MRARCSGRLRRSIGGFQPGSRSGSRVPTGRVGVCFDLWPGTCSAAALRTSGALLGLGPTGASPVARDSGGTLLGSAPTGAIPVAGDSVCALLGSAPTDASPLGAERSSVKTGRALVGGKVWLPQPSRGGGSAS